MFVFGWCMRIKFLAMWILYMDTQLTLHTTTELMIISMHLYRLYEVRDNMILIYIAKLERVKSVKNYITKIQSFISYLYG
jgi:hypothetical protein